jgi:hypothetical protein
MLAFVATHESGFVQGFGCRPRTIVPSGQWPASESRQGTNPREMERGKCRALGYGDLGEAEGACDGSQWARERATARPAGGRGPVLRVEVAAERGHCRFILKLARCI